MLIAPAAVSFSCLPPCPSSAEQHRRIPHFASLSDNPAFLFLFSCIRCKLPFSLKAVLQILHSDLLPSEFSRPKVLKMLPLLLCEEWFHHDAPHEFSAVNWFTIRNVCFSGLCIIDNVSFENLVLCRLWLDFTFGIIERPYYRQIIPLSLYNVIPENQKSRNFRSQSRFVELKTIWLWIYARFTWATTIKAYFPFMNLIPYFICFLWCIFSVLKDWQIGYASTSPLSYNHALCRYSFFA